MSANAMTIDPALAALFATSLKPTNSSAGSFPQGGVISDKEIVDQLRSVDGTDESGTDSDSISDGVQDSIVDDSEYAPDATLAKKGVSSSSNRKRKRRDGEDNLEGAYMQRLMHQEAKENVKRQQKREKKRLKVSSSIGTEDAESSGDDLRSNASSADLVEVDNGKQMEPAVPQHESLATGKEESEVEKASRTVFLANVSTLAIKSKSSKRLLLDHLGSFIPSLSENSPAHKVESLRFRSTAFATGSVPKKAAYVRKELMDATTQCTNAYVVYTTALAAREAVKKLNGTVILDRHLRVDGVAHPAKTDHRRCIFVGNLGFVDDESMIKAAEDEGNKRKPRKAKEPADVEEGLWRQFTKAGEVESVRVIRDSKTRVGKGIAYVQFKDANAVEKALLLNEKKFPPMLPRVLRVTRAKNIKKTASHGDLGKPLYRNPSNRPSSVYEPKISSHVQSFSGRAGKLLGRAGAAQFRSGHEASRGDGTPHHKHPRITKSPKPIVFEGYRASSRQGKSTLKLGGWGKKQGKPRTRSSRRGATFKASRGKKSRS